MASGNTGTLTSAAMYGTQDMRANFYWNISNVNPDAGTANLHYRLYLTSPSSIEYKSYGTGDRNFCKINGSNIFAFSNVGNGTYSNPFKMYRRWQQHDPNTVRWVTPPNYTFSGYVVSWGELASGDITIYYDDNGNASFSVYGAFQCLYGPATDKRVYINDTVHVDKIERNSSVSLKRGSTWDTKGGNIWYKSGSWSKKNFYRRENGSWNKK